MRWLRPWLLAAVLAAAASACLAQSPPAGVASAEQIALGRSIYLQGRLADGSPLQGQRHKQDSVSGQTAACVNCHRGSGLGSVEGNVAVPSITGRALFGSADAVVVRQDRRFDPGLSAPHAAYTPASLATALRTGITPSGHTLGALMPRYTLGDNELQALVAYLSTLSAQWSPGAQADAVHVATVIAPGMESARRQAFLATLQTLLTQMNGNVVSGQRQKLSAIERHMSVRRKLVLDVWQLEGPASTWQAQLDERQQRHPVFAILSGLGGLEWQPVQDFCDARQVVCWFPSLDLVPGQAAQSAFSLYFGGGVRTEAAVMAAQAGASGARVVQVVGRDPLAQAGAQALQQALPTGQAQLLRADQADIAQALQALRPQDQLMAWLGPNELPQLRTLPATVSQLLLSATLAGEDAHALADTLPAAARLVQTLELADIRQANLARFDAWQQGSQLPLHDRKMQSEVYFAARSLVSMLRGMLNNLYTPYLVERAEATLGMFEAMQVQDEVQSRMMAPVNKRPQTAADGTAPSPAAAPAQARSSALLARLLQRGGTTMYPRLSLAPGQRLASKGAYLLPLHPVSTAAEPQWLTP